MPPPVAGEEMRARGRPMPEHGHRRDRASQPALQAGRHAASRLTDPPPKPARPEADASKPTKREQLHLRGPSQPQWPTIRPRRESRRALIDRLEELRVT